MFSLAEIESARRLLTAALEEDLNDVGDVTSLATIPESSKGQAAIVFRKAGIIAGLPLLKLLVEHTSTELTAQAIKQDGDSVNAGETVAIMAGSMQAILLVERTVLNMLQRMSGVATLTRQYVDAVAGFAVKILDTRKTIPGWRLLDKYAVKMGGGTNHRLGLFDGILIKDNHLAALRPAETAIAQAIAAARQSYPQLPLEVEVDSLVQLEQALPLQPEMILLDNMPPTMLREAVARRNQLAPAVRLEASGGVNLTTVREIAATGVDRISVGALTHSAPALDIGLDYLS